jgi:peptidoglycan hydrolase-like protein with peptidoglycan-binding domain
VRGWWGTAAIVAALVAAASLLLAPGAPAAVTDLLPPLLPPSPPPTTAPPAPVPPEGLGPGDQGPQVAELEQALAGLHYDPGPVDGAYDGATTYAVVAFQKVTGLPRTGRATQDVVDALGGAQPPAPLVPGGATRVEIDLARQVLLLWEGDALTRVLPVSTGSGRTFCEGGSCRRAVTPAGSFAVYRKTAGWRESELGRLYDPVYFNGGIAVHGYPSVPAEPASHGCVRIPMAEAPWFFERVAVGTPVYVVGATG